MFILVNSSLFIVHSQFIIKPSFYSPDIEHAMNNSNLVGNNHHLNYFKEKRNLLK